MTTSAPAAAPAPAPAPAPSAEDLIEHLRSTGTGSDKLAVLKAAAPRYPTAAELVAAMPKLGLPAVTTNKALAFVKR